MLPVLELSLIVEQMVCVVEILDLPCLASRNNLNLTSEDMADLLRQGISVDDNNDPTPQEMYVTENTPLPQLEEEDIWIPEGFI